MPRVNAAQRGNLRREKAELTRAHIRESARRLFAARGYGATTLAAVAEAAGVAVQTIYAVYGSKSEILRALREAVMRDPIADGLYHEALSVSPPRQKLALLARSVRARWERGQDIVTVHEDAARSDIHLRREVDAVLATRRGGLAQLARSMQRDLPSGVTVDRATAALDALTLPSVYVTLVATHGWRPDEYEAWLARALQHAMLG